MKNSLIVPQDSKKIYFGLFVSTGMSLLLIFYLSLTYKIKNVSAIILLLRIILFFLLGFFSFGTIFWLFSKKDGTALILDSKGIRLKNHGFIPWSEIDEFNTYIFPTTPLEVIGIRFKNTSSISRQSTKSGKMTLFWARLFRYHYHISLANLAVENHVIVEYAKYFRQENS